MDVSTLCTGHLKIVEVMKRLTELAEMSCALQKVLHASLLSISNVKQSLNFLSLLRLSWRVVFKCVANDATEGPPENMTIELQDLDVGSVVSSRLK